jgi:CheY-like chemotaxis protein
MGRVQDGLRILIVEDNKDSRETLRTLLELLGHHVDVAEDGVEGIHKALTCSPMIALVDVGLPLLDGYKVAQCLRTVLGRKIFLVAHTGYGQPEDRRRAFEAGFDAHLVKPVDWLELHSWLSELSNSRR